MPLIPYANTGAGEAEKVIFKAFILNSELLKTKGENISLPGIRKWEADAAELLRPRTAPASEAWTCPPGYYPDTEWDVGSQKMEVKVCWKLRCQRGETT